MKRNPKKTLRNKADKPLRKKGETKHHISYEPEIIVLLPSRGSHLILTSFQSMSATKRNIKYLKDYLKAVRYILEDKKRELENKEKQLSS